jgi:hypothetical protein
MCIQEDEGRLSLPAGPSTATSIAYDMFTLMVLAATTIVADPGCPPGRRQSWSTAGDSVELIVGDSAALAAREAAVQAAQVAAVHPTTVAFQPQLCVGHDIGLAGSGPSLPPGGPRDTAAGVVDESPKRRRAVEYSDWYYRRLTIHRIGSFVQFPLFAAEYVVGQKLLTASTPSQSMRSLHGTLASGIAVLFGVNTVTGLWNAWDARHDPAGRTRRLLHGGIMLAADAGFVWTGQLANGSGDGAREGGGGGVRAGFNAQRHRNVAVGAMAVSTLGTLMMWLWKN